MGPGEDYWHKWCAWFFELPSSEKADYRAEWPEPQAWAGSFDYIESSYKVAPSREEQCAAIEAAGGPIRGDEVEITDPARIIWLTLNGLTADDSGEGSLRWVDGSRWRKLYEGETYKPRLVRQDG
jgi:hypothetical protein